MPNSTRIHGLSSILVFLCAAGCSGGEATPDAGADASLPIDEELHQDLTDYCESAGPILCRVPFACCDSGERGYFDEVRRETACPDFLEPTCLQEVEEVVAARASVELDDRLAARLLDRLEDAASSCELSYSTLFRALSPRTVLRGTAPTGTECTLVSELPICADECVGNEEDGYFCGEGVEEGEECFRSSSGTFYGCAAGLVCVWEDSELRCREPLSDGQQCYWDYQCESGYCHGSCATATPCRP